MQDAKANHTQIIVFPEYGLTGDGTTDGKDWTRAGAHTGLTSRQASRFRICHTAAAESLVDSESCMQLAPRHSEMFRSDEPRAT